MSFLESMQLRFQQLGSRDQQALILLGGFLTAVLLLVLVLLPAWNYSQAGPRCLCPGPG